jgi:leucine dehydrogenase
MGIIILSPLRVLDFGKEPCYSFRKICAKTLQEAAAMNNQLLEKPVDSKKRLNSLIQEGQKLATLQFETIAVKGYEQVIKVTDKKAGLNAIIAIHDTTLGPALGGTRIFPYANFNDALEDVLRLSKGMTYKSAVSEVGFGGGKSVIIADPKKGKTPEMLTAFGMAVEKLSGAYICAEDLGCTMEDVKIIRRATKYVVGLPHAKSSGDPGPFTSWGTFRGIQSALKKITGSESVEGRTIAVQGLGNVGSHLIDHLFWAGAKLILSDIDPVKLQRFATRYGAKAVPIDQILKIECDILAPCALGGIINDQTIPHFRCRAIAGSANNQLLRDSHANVLREKGILYAPDFVINAGGLLNVAAELEDSGYHPAAPRYKIHHFYDTLLAIYEIAEKNRESTHNAALALADYRIKYGIGKRVIPPTFHHSPE